MTPDVSILSWPTTRNLHLLETLYAEAFDTMQALARKLTSLGGDRLRVNIIERCQNKSYEFRSQRLDVHHAVIPDTTNGQTKSLQFVPLGGQMATHEPLLKGETPAAKILACAETIKFSR